MIANTFIKRPVTAIVISVVLVITGIISILNSSIEQYPNITPPVVQVNGQFTGADALTVEQTVATPIEQQVNGTPEMARCRCAWPGTSPGRPPATGTSADRPRDPRSPKEPCAGPVPVCPPAAFTGLGAS